MNNKSLKDTKDLKNAKVTKDFKDRKAENNNIKIEQFVNVKEESNRFDSIDKTKNIDKQGVSFNNKSEKIEIKSDYENAKPTITTTKNKSNYKKQSANFVNNESTSTDISSVYKTESSSTDTSSVYKTESTSIDISSIYKTESIQTDTSNIYKNENTTPTYYESKSVLPYEIEYSKDNDNHLKSTNGDMLKPINSTTSDDRSIGVKTEKITGYSNDRLNNISKNKTYNKETNKIKENNVSEKISINTNKNLKNVVDNKPIKITENNINTKISDYKGVTIYDDSTNEKSYSKYKKANNNKKNQNIFEENSIAEKLKDEDSNITNNADKIADTSKFSSNKASNKVSTFRTYDEKISDKQYRKTHSKPNETKLQNKTKAYSKIKVEQSNNKLNNTKSNDIKISYKPIYKIENSVVISSENKTTNNNENQHKQYKNEETEETEQSRYTNKIRDEPINDRRFTDIKSTDYNVTKKQLQKSFNAKIFEETRSKVDTINQYEVDDKDFIYKDFNNSEYLEHYKSKENKEEFRENIEKNYNRKVFIESNKTSDKANTINKKYEKPKKTLDNKIKDINLVSNNNLKENTSINNNKISSNSKKSNNNIKSVAKNYTKEIAKEVGKSTVYASINNGYEDTEDEENSKNLIFKGKKSTDNINVVAKKYKKLKERDLEKIAIEKVNNKIQNNKKIQEKMKSNKNFTRPTNSMKSTNIIQKKVVKKQYANEVRKSSQEIKNITATIKKVAGTIKDGVGIIGKAVTNNPFVSICCFIIILIGIIFSNAMPVFQGGGAIMVSSFVGDDSTLIEVDNHYSDLENNLKQTINNTETIYPDYDVYTYDTVEIGHDSYALISYLTIKFKGEFSLTDDVKAELERLLDLQYSLTYTEYTTTDDDGNELTGLKVILTQISLATVIKNELTDEEYELYQNFMIAKGNRPNLFDEFLSSQNGNGQYTDYEIPPEYLTDDKFRALITEAEKYLGYPYVWGGSTPSTSFDCSGYVCWVLKASGVFNISRTTAQGVFNQTIPISPSEATAGDLVFFSGTYNSTGAVSHIGIYVGNNKMIHCGDPIAYADLGNSYWSSHFYAFTRIP